MAIKKKIKTTKKTAKKTAKKTTKKAVKKQTTKKRVIKKKPIKKKALKEKIIGTVTHYFPKVRAAVVKLKAPLSIGEAVRIKGHTTDFIQNVNSIQIDRVPIQSAKKGEEIGLLVDSRVRTNDLVIKP